MFLILWLRLFDSMKEIEKDQSVVAAVEEWLQRAAFDYESFLTKFAMKYDIDTFESNGLFTGACLCEVGAIALGKAFSEKWQSESYFSRLWIPKIKGIGIKHTVFMFSDHGEKFLIDGTYRQIDQTGSLLLLIPAETASSRFNFVRAERISYEAMMRSIKNYPEEIEKLACLLVKHM